MVAIFFSFILYTFFSCFSQLSMPHRQIPTTIPQQSMAHSSMTSSPSSGPRTASNSFLSTTSTMDEENNSGSVMALTDLHEQPNNLFTAPYYSVAIDSLDGGGALQEEVGGVRLGENQDGCYISLKNGSNEFEDASTEVSNASSSREDLTSASEVEINMERRERMLIRHEQEDTESSDLKHIPIKELTYTEGSSLLSPVTYSTSHFSALTGLESIDSAPTKTDHT